MRKRSLLILTLLLAAALAVGALAQGALSKEQVDEIVNTTTDASKISSPITEVAKNASQSIVGVNNYRTPSGDYYGYGFGYFSTPRQSGERLSAAGSGVVVSPWGHILTNNHVIDEATRVTVSYEKQEFEAEVVARDAALDLAVLLAPGVNLPAVQLGDSDQLQVGEYAIVIGNPLGEKFERTVTVGYVSALNREVNDTVSDRYGRYATVKNKMIQVDAAINQGNSGGGMFNVLGQLQGIPARKYDNRSSASSFFGISGSSASIDNIGMCIPINVAKPLLQQVLENYDANSVKAAESTRSAAPWPRLGVVVKTLTAQETHKNDGTLPNGAYVVKVEGNSPAEQAGVKNGDIIVEVDDTVINNSTQLSELIREHKEGDELKVKVFRLEGEQDPSTLNTMGKGSYIDLSVTLRLLDDVKM